MSGRIFKFALVILIVASVVYVFMLNPGSVGVSLKPGKVWEAPLALVLVITFLAGAGLMFLFSLLFGLKLQFRTRKAIKQGEMVKNHHDLINSAREQLALGNFMDAREKFEKIISRDPDNIGARVLLAKTFQNQGDAKGALGILEDARVEQKKNIELLLLAADLNAQLGNPTAAFDNARLVLKLAPSNRFALRRLVENCRELGRFEEAITYQKQLVKIEDGPQHAEAQDCLAQIEVEHALEAQSDDGKALRKQLQDILRRHKNFPPALAALARAEHNAGDTKEASSLLVKAYQGEKKVAHLEEIASIWLEEEKPSKAIDAIRSALKARSKGEESDPGGQLFLVKLLLHLESVDEAKRLFAEVEESAIYDERERLDAALIKARLLQKEGNLDSAFTELLEVVDPAIDTSSNGGNGVPITLVRSSVAE